MSQRATAKTRVELVNAGELLGGTGGQEPRRLGCRRQERKGREAGVLRGRKAGEKCEMLIILIKQCVRILSKTSNQIIFDLHLTSSQSLLRLPSKQANENLHLG